MENGASKPSRALLLLPLVPSPPSYLALKAAYNPTLSSVLSSLSKSSVSSLKAAVLEVAVPCSLHFLYGQPQLPRSHIYGQTQKLVAGMYSLISAICARDSIDIEGQGGVDARIILLAYAKDVNHDGQPPAKIVQGPIIDLPTLVLSRRDWKCIYSVQSEAGEILLKEFVQLTDLVHGSSSKRPRWNVQRVDGGVGMIARGEEDQPGPEHESEHRRHYTVANGGTFDHLHAGHKLLLTMTALLLEPAGPEGLQRRIIAGITQDSLLKNKKYAEYLESWEDRQHGVSEFLVSILDFNPPDSPPPNITRISNPGPNGRAVHLDFDQSLRIECVAISDPFGPTITDESVSALVVSGETRSGGQAVNTKRQGQGWPALEVFEVDVLEAVEYEDDRGMRDNFEGKISSTELRRRWMEKSRSGKGSAL